jgi:hypothetical protein
MLSEPLKNRLTRPDWEAFQSLAERAFTIAGRHANFEGKEIFEDPQDADEVCVGPFPSEKEPGTATYARGRTPEALFEDLVRVIARVAAGS